MLCCNLQQSNQKGRKMSDEIFDSEYYEQLVCQQRKELVESLHTVGFALAYQIRITEEAKQNYLRYHESLTSLKRDYEALDRSLAQLDGRHKQCKPAAEVERQRRKDNPRAAKRSLTPAQYLSCLSREQKAELVKELMKG
jgi:hypothetical protein